MLKKIVPAIFVFLIISCASKQYVQSKIHSELNLKKKDLLEEMHKEFLLFKSEMFKEMEKKLLFMQEQQKSLLNQIRIIQDILNDLQRDNKKDIEKTNLIIAQLQAEMAKLKMDIQSFKNNNEDE